MGSSFGVPFPTEVHWTMRCGGDEGDREESGEAEKLYFEASFLAAARFLA